MKKQLIFLFVFVWFLQNGWAQDLDRTGTAAAQFLRFSANARVAALAGACVALEDSPGSLGLNPAGIARLPDRMLSLTTQRLYLSLTQQDARLIWPVGNWGVLGIQTQYFSSGSMEVTTVAQPEGTGRTFQMSSLLASVTAARQVTDRVALGLTVKYIREAIYHETAQTWAFDLGALVQTGLWGLRLGVSLTNIGGLLHLEGTDLHTTALNDLNFGQNLELKTDYWSLPTQYRIGFVWPLVAPEGQFWKSENHRVQVLAALRDANDAPLQEQVGVEYAWEHRLFVQTGWFLHHSTARWAAGAGFQYPVASFLFRFQYGWQHFVVFSDVHVMTMTIIYLNH